MILEFLRMEQKRISLALFVFSAVLGVVMVSRVVACKGGQTRIPAAVKSAAEKGVLDEEAVKKHLVRFTECANGLKKQNMFTSSPPKPKPPMCTGIIGDRAIIGGKGYRVGEKVAGAEIVSIGTRDITILWEGAEKTLDTFADGPSNAPQPSHLTKLKKRPPIPVKKLSPASQEASAPARVAPQMPPNMTAEDYNRMMEFRQRRMQERMQMGGGQGRGGTRPSDDGRRGSRGGGGQRPGGNR